MLPRISGSSKAIVSAGAERTDSMPGSRQNFWDGGLNFGNEKWENILSPKPILSVSLVVRQNFTLVFGTLLEMLSSSMKVNGLKDWLPLFFSCSP